LISIKNDKLILPIIFDKYLDYSEHMNRNDLCTKAANRGLEAYGKYGALLAHIDLCTYGAKMKSKLFGKQVPISSVSNSNE